MVHAPSALPRLSLKGVPKHSPEHGRRYKSGESILKGSILPSIQGSQGLPNPRDRKGANLLFPDELFARGRASTNNKLDMELLTLQPNFSSRGSPAGLIKVSSKFDQSLITK